MIRDTKPLRACSDTRVQGFAAGCGDKTEVRIIGGSGISPCSAEAGLMSLKLPHGLIGSGRLSLCLCACDCPFGVQERPVHVSLTCDAERVRGIRPTCIIQLVFGRRVCPHPLLGEIRQKGNGGGSMPCIQSVFGVGDNKLVFFWFLAL